MIDDRYLLVRAFAVYLAAVGVTGAALWRRPGNRAYTGALLAFFWNVPALLAVHVAASVMGWWSYDAEGGLLLGMPVDLWLAWAVLWGAVPAILFPSQPLWLVMTLALAIDLVAMPAAAPVVQLGPHWLVGEAVALLVCVWPSQLLARWTAADRHLTGRALLQIIAFTGLLVTMVVVAIDASATEWTIPVSPTRWRISLALQLLAIPVVLGLTAVQEFMTRGNGTPLPYDPPRRLVTSGVYAYVANPMQLSAVIMFLMAGAMLGNIWVAAVGLGAFVYSAGIASWDEGGDLEARFGDSWRTYRRHVRNWIPRWRPWHGDVPVATLYVAGACTMCQEVARWFRERGASGVDIVPAETAPVPLTRITYQPADGTVAVSGTNAIARALEHIHFGWALMAFVIRLPIVSPLIQLLVDASGGGPRTPTCNTKDTKARRVIPGNASAA